jgi:hypothetical protein
MSLGLAIIDEQLEEGGSLLVLTLSESELTFDPSL